MEAVLNKLTDNEKQALDLLFNTPKEKNRRDRSGFSAIEDTLLITFVKIYGEHSWTSLQGYFPGRQVRQLRERYLHYLAPGINHKPWTPEEDQMLQLKYAELGPKWVAISKFFNRSEVSVKNRWVSIIRKRNETKQVKTVPDCEIDTEELKKFNREFQDTIPYDLFSNSNDLDFNFSTMELNDFDIF